MSKPSPRVRDREKGRTDKTERTRVMENRMT